MMKAWQAGACLPCVFSCVQCPVCMSSSQAPQFMGLTSPFTKPLCQLISSQCVTAATLPREYQRHFLFFFSWWEKSFFGDRSEQDADSCPDTCWLSFNVRCAPQNKRPILQRKRAAFQEAHSSHVGLQLSSLQALLQ